jgi:crotonobetainyl-CoA:carnitine CoA-transferase CaiB-like acyl-CoA transferase
MSASPVAYDRGPPTLGEHTGEVLAEWLGVDAQALATLKADSVI